MAGQAVYKQEEKVYGDFLYFCSIFHKSETTLNNKVNLKINLILLASLPHLLKVLYLSSAAKLTVGRHLHSPSLPLSFTSSCSILTLALVSSHSGSFQV